MRGSGCHRVAQSGHQVFNLSRLLVSPGTDHEVSAFLDMVVDDEGLRPDKVRVRVRSGVGRGKPRQGQRGAFIADEADPAAAKRQVGERTGSHAGGELVGKQAQHVGSGIRQAVAQRFRQRPSRRADDAESVAGCGVQPEGVPARAHKRSRGSLCVDCFTDAFVVHSPRAEGEEVAEQLCAVLGQHRLGVELHTPVRLACHLEALDHTVLAAGVDNHPVRDVVDVQRVVAHGRETLRQPGEDALAGVGDRAGVSVPGVGAPDLGPGEVGEALMTQADPEDGNPARRLDHGARAREVGFARWGPRTGGDDDVGELTRLYAAGEVEDRDIVRAHDHRLAPGDFGDEVGEVEGVGVAVVDKQDQMRARAFH